MESIKIMDSSLMVPGNGLIEADSAGSLNKIKDNLYVMEFNNENNCRDNIAEVLAKSSIGEGVNFIENEGKISLISKSRGLLKVNFNALMEINNIDNILFSTLHTNQIVNENTVIAEINTLTFANKADKIKEIKRICRNYYPVVSIKSFNNLKVGIITTGNELYYKSVKDIIIPALNKKFNKLRCMIICHQYSKYRPEMVADSIKSLAETGAEIIAVTGEMLENSSSIIYEGIRKSGADIVAYGVPAMPGSDFILSYLEGIPVVVLPGSVMRNVITTFDMIIPRLAAGERLTKKDVISMGHGGLCRKCKECSFPNCGMGKGGVC